MYYLGWRTLGIIGMIDASECVPTFGAGAVYRLIHHLCFILSNISPLNALTYLCTRVNAMINV